MIDPLFNIFLCSRGSQSGSRGQRRVPKESFARPAFVSQITNKKREKQINNEHSITTFFTIEHLIAEHTSRIAKTPSRQRTSGTQPAGDGISFFRRINPDNYLKGIHL